MIEIGGTSITAINIIIGLIVLTLGRQLFWLFVGCIGFAIGLHYAPYLWNVQSNLLLLLLASLTGIIGAVLAFFFQKVAIGLAGFAGGGFIALNLFYVLGVRMEQIIWLPSVIGGVIGIFLLFFIFDWALIVFSSLTGATMIVQAVNLTPGVKQIVYFALVIMGIAIQAFWYRKTPSVRE
ncbi:hypothetical protein D1BOALGB6SA_6174 [Olavius sp. associated proteobacterium Delta 1]|nr:hypothetical protein D1BOALGB6SA_6174 [Olavius sp. associated proteobacterium Delta 1]